MNESAPLTEPDKTTRETPTESFVIEQNEPSVMAAPESDAAEAGETSGIIELP